MQIFLLEVIYQDTLLNNFKAGRRNYTVFQVGKATLLRVSDVMRLKQTDIFNPDGSIKQNAFIHDRKTGKPNTLYLKPVQTELLLYRQWLLDHRLASEWLFPSIQHPERHITEKQFYKIMSKVGDLLGLSYPSKIQMFSKKFKIRYSIILKLAVVTIQFFKLVKLRY
ncbi:tyrosine-type recombinase/integrase [Lactiplantibacillus plantarum]|uniref:tyrosine-type recombinase/integrase n=1 Tax=Lactiplantibacillus plantarum TaxID=1590 RepID=UPI002044699F|nr:tyrosine-type recombinase/integrase [Lactiplantibacillus plantarum]